MRVELRMCRPIYLLTSYTRKWKLRMLASANGVSDGNTSGIAYVQANLSTTTYTSEVKECPRMHLNMPLVIRMEINRDMQLGLLKEMQQGLPM